MRPRNTLWGGKKHEIANSENECSEYAKRHFSAGRPRKKGQNGPTLAEIRQRSFEIHMERCGIHGCDLDDWQQAERELQEKYNKINDERQKEK